MIQVITTGGTIEGLEYDNPVQAPSVPPMPIEDLLRKIENIPKYQIKRLLVKDSRFLNNQDRTLISSEIKKSDASKIIITHGTLTMVETARFLGQQKHDKTIILTGAFILGTEPNTDAIDNLGFALSQFDQLSRGVYIAMHQSIFPWENVKKNNTTNQFEKLNQKDDN